MSTQAAHKLLPSVVDLFQNKHQVTRDIIQLPEVTSTTAAMFLFVRRGLCVRLLQLSQKALVS